MNIKKLSLLLLILGINTFSTAMETTKQSINAGMSKLAQKTFNCYQKAKAAEQQVSQDEKEKINKEIEQISQEIKQINEEIKQNNQTDNNLFLEFQQCIQQKKIESETFYFWQPYTVDCEPLRKAYYDHQKKFNSSEKHAELIKKRNKQNELRRTLNTKGIDYDNALQLLTVYGLFENSLKLCTQLNDISCFKELEKKLREWNENN